MFSNFRSASSRSRSGATSASAGSPSRRSISSPRRTVFTIGQSRHEALREVLVTDASVSALPAPRAGRFYYGWIVLGVAALAMVGTLPGRTQGLGLITEPLLR